MKNLSLAVAFLSTVCCATARAQVVEVEELVSPETRRLLETALGSRYPSVRSRAAGALARVGSGAASALRQLLQDDDPTIKAIALVGLQSEFTESDLALLCEEACQSDYLAPWAVRVIASIPGERAYASLWEIGPKLTGHGRRAWGRVVAGRSESPPAAALKPMLQGSLFEQLAGVDILKEHPAAIRPESKLELLGSANPVVRATVLVSLCRSGSKIADDVIGRALKDGSYLVQRAALICLRRQQFDLAELTPLLTHSDSTVRREAVSTVAGMVTAPSFSLLSDRLRDTEPLVIERVVSELGRIDREFVTPTVLDSLQELVATRSEDEVDLEVIASFIKILGLRGARESLDLAAELSAHSSPKVRAACYQLFGRVGGEEQVSLMLKRVRKEAGMPRLRINEALGLIGDPRGFDHLMLDLHYPDVQSRGLDASLFVAENLSPPAPFSKQDTAIAAAAARSLGQLGNKNAAMALVEVVRDVLRNDSYWTAVAWSLGQIGDANAADALKTQAVEGLIIQGAVAVLLPNETRIEALNSIARLQLNDLIPVILATDGPGCKTPVREAAARALSQMTGKNYKHRIPFRYPRFFLSDNAKPVDVSVFDIPICYALEN